MPTYYVDPDIRNANIILDYKNNLTIQEIANKHELSYAHAGRLVRKLIPEYTRRYKMDEADRALKNKYYHARQKRLEPIKKYSPEWTELQWKQGYEREAAQCQ